MNAAAPHPAQTQPAGGTLLSQLEEAHEHLSAALAAMEVATRAPSSEKSDYADARWRLSQASRQRRGLVGRICQQLAPQVAPADAAVLKEHHASDLRMLHASAAHVGKWSMESIEADWAGYCEASRVIRRTMQERLRAEKQLLYPNLRKYPQLG